MNELLLYHWGERAYQRSGRLRTLDVDDGRLIAAERSAHIRACCKILWQALCEGVFEALVRLDGQKPERIPPNSWMSVCRYDIRINFTLGKAYAGPRHDSPLKPIEGGVFLFEIEKVTQWLTRLSSVHILPKPLKRHPWSLKPGPSVTQCEAISWLADGDAKTAAQLQLESTESSSYVDEVLDETRVHEFGEWSLQRIGFEDFVASEMARTVRINRVGTILRDSIFSGEIEAFGCFVDGGGHGRRLAKVDPDFFLHAVSLSCLHDQISTDANAEGEAYREARSAGYWKQVRFRRTDLVRLFGSGDMDFGSGDLESRASNEPETVAKIPGDKSESTNRYQQRIEDWPHDADPPTRTDDELWCRSELGLTRDRARQLRRDLAPESWQQPGRRKQSGGN